MLTDQRRIRSDQSDDALNPLDHENRIVESTILVLFPEADTGFGAVRARFILVLDLVNGPSTYTGCLIKGGCNNTKLF